jgi:hypothetical protein
MNRGIRRRNQTEYPPHPRNKIAPPTSLTQVTHRGVSSLRVSGPGQEQLEEGGRDQVINQNVEHRPTFLYRSGGGEMRVPGHPSVTNRI